MTAASRLARERAWLTRRDGGTAAVRRWRMRRRLGGCLALMVLAYLLAAQSQTGWLYLVVALLGGAVPCGLLYPALAVRGLRAQARVLSPAGPLHEGQTLVVEVTLTNPTRLPRYWLVVADLSGLAAASDSVGRHFVACVPARAGAVMRWELLCARRGVYIVPSVSVTTMAPFGLARAEWPVAANALLSVTVYPRWWPLPDGAPPAGFPDGARVAQRQEGGDVSGARPYRPGDNLRWVHWRSTARHGQLIVREFEQTYAPTMTVVLDASTSPILPTPSPLFDVAVRLVASAIHWGLSKGYAVSLSAHGADPPAPVGPLTRRQANEYLARLWPGGAEVPGDLPSSLSPGAVLLVVLPRPRPDLLPALHSLQARGALLTVAYGVAGPDVPPAFAAALSSAGVRAVSFTQADLSVEAPLC